MLLEWGIIYLVGAYQRNIQVTDGERGDKINNCEWTYVLHGLD